MLPWFGLQVDPHSEGVSQGLLLHWLYLAAASSSSDNDVDHLFRASLWQQ